MPVSASIEVVRDINRRIVLNLIRTRQPISGADLARVSGMQRSTISLADVNGLGLFHHPARGAGDRLSSPAFRAYCGPLFRGQ
jgi:hypothetical protein